MQQMCRDGIAGIFLILCSWQDIKTKMLSVKLLLLFGAGGILLNVMYETPWQACIRGLLPGVVLLFWGKLSEEQIGYGDGMAAVVLGLLLPGGELLLVLMMGFFLCAVSAVFLFFAGNRKRNLSVPFLPFLTAGFGIKLLL